MTQISQCDQKGPLFRQNGTEDWYFWDEAWTSCKGPYRSAEIAQAALTLYAEYELDGQQRLPQWIQ
jgi:hypothetical protein